MRNNPYKNLIKALTPKKGDMLAIQSVDGDVYITNGHIAFQLSFGVYNAYLHLEKPLVFPIIEDGTCIRNGEKSDMDIKECMSRNRMTAIDYSATPTCILKDLSDGRFGRLFLIETTIGEMHPLMMDERYYQTVSGFSCEVYCNGKSNYPVWFDHDDFRLIPYRCLAGIRIIYANLKSDTFQFGAPIYPQFQ